jgi:membrane-associated protease RseP (regulator of RpoE activity)
MSPMSSRQLGFQLLASLLILASPTTGLAQGDSTSTELERLRERVAELEARVAELEGLLGDVLERIGPDPGSPSPYVSPEEQLELDGDTVPGYPWLRRLPGVRYARPVAVPELLYRYYQDPVRAGELARQIEGRYRRLDDGRTAWEVVGLTPGSVLANRLGLQPGDRVLSVNGIELDDRPDAATLFEQLGREERFAVLLERAGEEVVFSYYVRSGSAPDTPPDPGPGLRELAQRLEVVMASYQPEDPQRSTVIVHDRSSGEQRAVGIGDRIDGYEVLEIVVRGQGDEREVVVVIQAAGGPREVLLRSGR